MKKILNHPIVDPFTDKPYTVNHPDGETEKKTVDGKSILVVRSIPLTTIWAIRIFLNNAFRDPNPTATMDDSFKAMSIMKALRRTKTAGDPYVELEDDDHEWLLSSFKGRGLSVFHILTSEILATFRKVYETPALVGQPGELVGKSA